MSALGDALSALAGRGLRPVQGSLSKAIDEGKRWARENGELELIPALEHLRAVAPSAEGLARHEVTGLLIGAFRANVAGDPALSNLAYEERRKLSKAITAEARAEAEAAAERFRLLGEVLTGLGEVAKVALPVLITAL